jgi:hypothetical protein
MGIRGIPSATKRVFIVDTLFLMLKQVRSSE